MLGRNLRWRQGKAFQICTCGWRWISSCSGQLRALWHTKSTLGVLQWFSSRPGLMLVVLFILAAQPCIQEPHRRQLAQRKQIWPLSAQSLYNSPAGCPVRSTLSSILFPSIISSLLSPLTAHCRSRPFQIWRLSRIELSRYLPIFQVSYQFWVVLFPYVSPSPCKTIPVSVYLDFTGGPLEATGYPASSGPLDHSFRKGKGTWGAKLGGRSWGCSRHSAVWRTRSRFSHCRACRPTVRSRYGRL